MKIQNRKIRFLFLAAALGGLCLPMQTTGAESHSVNSTDWPQFRGPTGSGVTGCAEPLITHLSQAKLVWISEERNLGVGWGLGHGSSGRGQVAQRSCGYSGPVAAAGRVYLQYFVPTGDVVDPRHAAAPVDKRPDSWKIEANDVLLCIDAATGKTLWNALLPHGRNVGHYGRNGNYQHPTILGDRVFVQGNAGWAHAVDANNGQILWSAGVGPSREHWEALVGSAIVNKDVQQAGSGYGFNVSPVVAGGVMAMNDQVPVKDPAAGCSLVGLDLETGAFRWAVPNAIGRIVTPVVWRHAGKARVIGVCAERLVCVAMDTGKVLWEVPGPFHDNQTPGIQGDLLTVAHLEFRSGLQMKFAEAKRQGEISRKMSYGQWLDSGRGLSCYRLCEAGAPVVAWSLPIKFASGNASPVLNGDHGYFHTTMGVCAIDLKTGAFYPGNKASGYIALKAMGDRLFQYAQMWDISKPTVIRDAGAIGNIGGFMTIPYADGCVANGFLYLRGWIKDESLRVGDAPERGCVACFDLRTGVRSDDVAAILNGNLDDAAQLAALVRLASDDNGAVRAEAIRAIGRMEGHAAVLGLFEILAADAIDARELAVAELVKRVDRQPIQDLLLDAMRDDNPVVRARAAEVAGKSHATAAVFLPSLIELAKDDNPEVMYAVGLALIRLAGQEPLPTVCIPPLFAHVHQGAAGPAYQALDLIAQMGPPALPFLLHAIEDEPQGYVRWRSAYAVGRMGAVAAEAIPALEDLAKKTKHPKVRQSLRKAILDIQQANNQQSTKGKP